MTAVNLAHNQRAGDSIINAIGSHNTLFIERARHLKASRHTDLKFQINGDRDDGRLSIFDSSCGKQKVQVDLYQVLEVSDGQGRAGLM